MMVAVLRNPTACAARITQPLLGVILSAQMSARTSSSRISAAVPGRLESPAARSGQVFAQRQPSVSAPWVISSGENACTCISGPLPSRRPRCQIGLPGVGGMDAALQAYLGGAGPARLHRAPRDLLEVEKIGRPAQVVRAAALGEGAEAALIAADVGVVDVAVDDEANGVAAGFPAQPIGGLQQRVQFLAARLEKRDDSSSLSESPRAARCSNRAPVIEATRGDSPRREPVRPHRRAPHRRRPRAMRRRRRGPLASLARRTAARMPASSQRSGVLRVAAAPRPGVRPIRGPRPRFPRASDRDAAKAPRD
jgi:hypothetical protein